MTVGSEWSPPKKGTIVVLDTNEGRGPAQIVAVDPMQRTAGGAMQVGFDAELGVSSDGLRVFVYSRAYEDGRPAHSARGVLRSISLSEASTSWEVTLGEFIGLRRTAVADRRVKVLANGSLVIVEFAGRDGSALVLSALDGRRIGTVRLPGLLGTVEVPGCVPRIALAAASPRAFAWCGWGHLYELDLLPGERSHGSDAHLSRRRIEVDIPDAPSHFRESRDMAVPAGIDRPPLPEGYTPPPWIAAVVPSPDGRLLYVATIDGRISVVDTNSDRIVRVGRIELGKREAIGSRAPIVLTGDGETLVVTIAPARGSTTDPARLVVVDTESLKVRSSIEPGEPIHDLAIGTPDSSLFAANPDGGRILLIDLDPASISAAFSGIGKTPALVFPL